MGWTSTPGKTFRQTVEEMKQSEDGWEVIDNHLHEVDRDWSILWQIVKIRAGTMIVQVLLEYDRSAGWMTKTISEAEGFVHLQGFPIGWIDRVEDPKIGYSTKSREKARGRVPTAKEKN